MKLSQLQDFNLISCVAAFWRVRLCMNEDHLSKHYHRISLKWRVHLRAKLDAEGPNYLAETGSSPGHRLPRLSALQLTFAFIESHEPLPIPFVLWDEDDEEVDEDQFELEFTEYFAKSERQIDQIYRATQVWDDGMPSEAFQFKRYAAYEAFSPAFGEWIQAEGREISEWLQMNEIDLSPPRPNCWEQYFGTDGEMRHFVVPDDKELIFKLRWNRRAKFSPAAKLFCS